MSVIDADSTREKLLAAALKLFAKRGYANVGVGDIEEAVGLVPRRGGLYRHFKSKDALLQAAVQRHINSEERARREFASFDGDLLEQATALGRRILQEMDTQREITRILERDGDRLPELAERFQLHVADRGYAIVTRILRSWIEHTCEELTAEVDLHSIAVLLTGALVNVRRSTWTFGQPPGGYDDERLLAAWAYMCVNVISPS